MKHVARLVAVLALASSAVMLAAPAHATPAEEAEALSRLNALRHSVGVAPLTVDSRLVTIARQWAAHMAAQGVMSHNPDLYSQAPSDWHAIGENVGFASTVAELQSLWENSSEHYRNMVDGEFTNVGIGIVEGGGYLWAVVDFTGGGALGTPAPSTPIPAAAPAPAPAPQADATPADSSSDGTDMQAADDWSLDDTIGFADDADAARSSNPALADDPVPVDA